MIRSIPGPPDGRSLRPGAVRDRPGRRPDLRPGGGGTARGPQGEPLDVVRVPADSGARPERDGPAVRDLLTRRGPGLPPASGAGPAADQLGPGAYRRSRAQRGADLRRPGRAETALVHDLVPPRRSSRAGIRPGPQPVFPRAARPRDRPAAGVTEKETRLHPAGV